MRPIDLETFAEQSVRWFGQSAFRITSVSGHTLYIDPAGIKNRSDSPPANLILITHPHSDHYNPQVVSRLSKNETVVVVPKTMETGSLKGITAGESIQTGPFRVTGVPAYNIKKKFHPQASGWLGYIIEVDGIKIYHAGDTDFIPEMNGLQPDLALLPVGGLFTMNVKNAVAAAETIQAKMVIPMHFWMIPSAKNTGRKFLQQYSGRAKLLEPKN